MNAGSIKNNTIAQKTEQLIQSIILLSKNLPKKSLYEFDSKLQFYIESLPAYLHEQEHLKRRIDKIRNMIKINLVMDECIYNLKMIDSLRYGDTSELQNKAIELHQIIENDFSLAKTNEDFILTKAIDSNQRN